MTYFFDNNISYRYAGMLKALGVAVVALRDVFPPDIKDPDLLRGLKDTDYVFVSSEQRMRRRPIEAALLRDANITALFFAPFWSNLGFWQAAIWLLRRWELIDGFARGVKKGTFAEVKQNGRSAIFQL
ncbi:MAG: hypothetical protein KY476_03155 [Planctomycetes bacterium]|nr:hypothetical protein [Planctomycetota bacterium]